MTLVQVISLLVSAMLIENVVLSQFLGICSFLGVSKKRKNAVGMGLAVVAVTIIATIVTWLIYNYVLVLFELTYLKTIVFILVIASLVQMIEVIIKKFVPSLYKSLGIYLPLITTNCAVLGVALKSVTNNLSFGAMLIYAIGSGLGYLFIMFCFSLIREEVARREVPKAMEGIPISLIIASILAILFSRYAGIVGRYKGTSESLNAVISNKSLIVIIAIILMVVLGLVFGILISLVSEKFKVEEDTRLKDVESMLPGANCGACGCAGCKNFAEKLLDNEVDPNGCKVLKGDKKEELIKYYNENIKNK